MEISVDQAREFPVRRMKFLRRELHYCHCHVALLYMKQQFLGYGHGWRIATGFSLGEDGAWFPHSWLWDGQRVVETNVRFKRYFGVVLGDAEAVEFILR